MDLKDVILSTLEELEGNQDEQPSFNDKKPDERPVQPIRPNPYEKERLSEETFTPSPHFSSTEEHPSPTPETSSQIQETPSPAAAQKVIDTPETIPEPEMDGGKKIRDEEELRFLTSLRERVLVLFEGIQSPNNKNIEAKVDLILNFFEYQLAVIDERIEQISTR